MNYMRILLIFLLVIAPVQVATAAAEKNAMCSIGPGEEFVINSIQKSATKGKNFDPEYWGKHLSSPITRLEMFNFFLMDYDLIGMKQSEVVLLLGEGYSAPDGYKGNFRLLNYTVESGGCDPNNSTNINIYFKGGKAIGWCFTQTDRCSETFTKNLLLKCEGEYNRKMVQVGEMMVREWPGVFPKNLERHTKGNLQKRQSK